MAANMQHMGAPGMMPQQQQRGGAAQGQLQGYLIQALKNSPSPLNGVTWHNSLSLQERLGKSLQLGTQLILSQGNNVDVGRVAQFVADFERETYQKMGSKEAYDQTIHSKLEGIFKKRLANEPALQSQLNSNAQAQAHAQAQAQAMMNIQPQQMGRGIGQQGFQQMQRQVQMPNMNPQQQQFRPQQQQPQQFPQQQQQQQQLQAQQTQQQMAMAMGNQAGRGTGQNPQMMGMQQNGQNRQVPGAPDMSRLAPADRSKVMELATKLMTTAPEDQRNQARAAVRQKLGPQAFQELHAQNKDPLHLFYQQQAFNILRANAARQQQQATQNQQNPDAAQPQMMQQQASQQSFQQQQQQRQNMMNAGNDFSQFTPSMESIKDQQMNGFMAQKAGQVVVPASSGPPRNGGSQPMAQSMSNQHQNQAPHHQQQQQPQQQQQQQGANMHQMKMNQAAQQSQAQLQAQAQMKQMQGQGAMGGMGPSQSPAMGTLNTPVSRPTSGMNQTGGQGAQANAAFGDQRFSQGVQRPNNQAYNAILASMSPEQRQHASTLPPNQFQELMRRWQQSRPELGVNGTQQQNQNPMANRPPSQFGQANANMGGQTQQGLQQMGNMNGNQQAQGRPQPANPNAQAMMDSMDLPANVIAQLGQLPPEVKKWRDLKVWANQNNTIPPQIRNQLGGWQHKQFQFLMQRRFHQDQQRQQLQQQGQQGPNMAANAGMAGPNGQMQQQNMQRPQAAQQPPANVTQVSPADMQQVRNSRPQFANVPDDQLRSIVMSMKRTAWQHQMAQRAQQAQQAQMQQGQTQAQGPQFNATPPAQPQVQQQAAMQPNSTPQAQARTPAVPAGQNAQPQQNPRDQKPATNNRGGKKAQNQAGGKNLKRPSTDNAVDVANSNAHAQRKGSQQGGQKNAAQGMPPLSNEDIANMAPEQRPKYEQMRAMANGGQALNQAQVASQSTAQNAGQNAPSAQSQAQQQAQDNLNRLRTIGQEEQRLFMQESQSMPDIPMSPEEHDQTSSRLRRIVTDMGKIGRGLSKWYNITKDDQRARLFFRMRLRIIKQFTDGEGMKQLRSSFSMRPQELEEARAMLESMARDLAHNFQKRSMGMVQKPPGAPGQTPQVAAQNESATQPQDQIAQQQRLMAQKQLEMNQAQQQRQQPQPQQSVPAPLNATNLEKNSQALKNQKAGSKGYKAPVAPTTAQPPFPFGASSPQGLPNYGAKVKDMNLQIPPRKRAKLDKQDGQGSQTATPSPKTATKTSPPQDVKRPPEPPKPVLLCKEPECQGSTVGYASEEALQQHINEEHVKPKENPLKFCSENLALALGLEADGSVKDAMSRTASKQGQTPGNFGLGTPKSQDGVGMKRSMSSQSKMPSVKGAGSPDSWAGSSFDSQSLLTKLGLPNGINSVVFDPNTIRSLTPKDTPESSKDSGSSEPNSDILEAPVPDFDVNWHTLDTDVLLDMNNSNFGVDFSTFDKSNTGTMDPTLLMDPTSPGEPDWSDVKIDFNAPFRFDTGRFHMDVN